MELNNISIFLKKDKIVIRIRDIAPIEDVVKELKYKLPELKKFYKEESTPILVTGKVLKEKEIDLIYKLIRRNIRVEVSFDIPRNMGLHGIVKNYKKEIASSNTKFIKRSMHSGQRVEYEGSIVILGDVNYGSEVVAEDNIVVVGTLRGLAHAGAKGNEEAIISAHLIDSPQIRIASYIKDREKDEIEREYNTFAYVSEEGKIELE